jgi:SAM-dependent methyltransferase
VGAFFGELYLRSTRPFLDPRVTRREAEFIVDALQLLPHERALDLCCGHGRHLQALAELGHTAIGLELDAASLATVPKPLRSRLVRGDLYALPFREAFPALFSWYASLLISEDDARNRAAVAQAASALEPGGRMLLHGHNPLAQRRETRSHFSTELAGGEKLSEEIWYDAAKDVLHGHRILQSLDGRTLEGEFQVRCPTLEDHRAWCEELGLKLESAWGDVNAEPPSETAPDLIVLVRKPR